jgi:hypothetical protein
MRNQNSIDYANSEPTMTLSDSDPTSHPDTGCGFMGLIPTPSERASGRLMRAEDHGEATILGDAKADDADAGDGKGADDQQQDDKSGDDQQDDKSGDDQQDDKPGDDKGADDQQDDKGDKEENALLGAPEGDYTITGLPEGTTIDTEALAMLTPIAKEIGLSDAGMSKLAEVYATKILPHIDAQVSTAIETQAATQRKDWEAETRLAISGGKDADGKAVEPARTDKGDPIYGGKDYKEVTQIAAKALDRLGTPELRQFLETTGLGNNEALVRFAFRAGMAIKEDDFDRGDGGGSKPKTLAETLYGNKGD